jgi:hypothetical protein
MNKFELSEETDAMVRFLKTQEKGAVVTYSELSRHVGIKITPLTGKLTYARHILQRDFNAVWICVKPAVGIKRLTDVEIAERLPTWWLNGARNKLSRGGAQADVVDMRELDINQQARFGVDSIQRELAFDALSRATRKKMEKVARGTSNDLPAFNVVEWAISLTAKPNRS